ncbi:hypothetical protein Clacol_005337 [Clathrus columnatus]|uniref:Restriction of telomere capping protein 4 n=1 Tax=Clathrus columnatus TaxID=1419009 RepID=A0AAV5AF25_9AGAM|nr:hypothetical protein Clacol_005337 [Clathrus columnatus]
MEAMRARFSIEQNLIPLGKSKGIVQESFGQTPFKVTSELSPPKTKKRSGSSGSDDDLDLLSQPSPPPSSMSSTKSIAAKGKKTSSVLRASPKRIKPRPKARMVGSNAKASSKPKPSASVSKKLDDILDMPPSNQSAYESREYSGSPLEELSQNTLIDKKENRSNKPKCKAEIQAFPMDVDKIKKSRGLKRLTGDKPNPLSPSPPKKAKISPRSPSKKPELAPFPMDIPPKKLKKKRPPTDSDSDDDLGSVKTSPISYGGLRPFPMSLTDIVRKPVPKIPEYPPLKPMEEFIMAAGPSKIAGMPGHAFVFLDPLKMLIVDPSKLCPYCDEPLPDEPSPKLRDLLKAVKKKSRKDPRPGNPLGLIASLIAFAEVCERHRLEMNYIPLAISQGWPTKIDFISIPDRIQRFRKSLEDLVANPENSTFWKDLKGDAAAIGRKKLASLTGQYATFEKSQPGYYGEQGSIIIQQTLYSVFPVGSILEEAVEPLTVEQFLSQVLVPETAALLIMEDMNLTSKTEALEVLEGSKKYGIAMFPERHDDAVADVGERLAMERALSRRKYLQEIGDTEEDIAREIQEEKRKALQKKKLTNTSASETDTDNTSHKSSKRLEKTVQKVDLKPKRKIKSRDYVELDDSSETPRASTKIREKTSDSAVLTSAQFDLDSLSSDDNLDVSWKINFRGDTLPSPGPASAKASVPPKDTFSSALDMTPKPLRNTKPKQKTKGSASEASDIETVLKRTSRPKPRPIKRVVNPEFVTEEVVSDVMKEGGMRKKDDYNWLLD